MIKHIYKRVFTNIKRFQSPNITNTIIKNEIPANLKRPKIDDRDMTQFTLPNKLRILHIHDPDQSSTNISLSQQVGSYDNPPQIAGLAHQLEHMLFIGSSKYPQVDQFSQLISKLNGSYNAYTSPEFTNQIAQVKTKDMNNIKLLLDVLANMVTDPLISEEYLKKEIQNIQSEQNMMLTKEAYLADEALNNQRNPSHPLSQFTCGNHDTLYQDVESKLKFNVKDIVTKFQTDNYHPSNACLVVSSFFSIKEMQDAIFQTVGKMERPDDYKLSMNGEYEVKINELLKSSWNLKNVDKNKLVKESEQPKFQPSLVNDLMVIENKSIGKENEIQLIQEIEFDHRQYKKDIINFLSNIFNNESKDNFKSVLKQKQQCVESSFGTQKSHLNAFNIQLSVELNEKSILKIEDILKLQNNQLNKLLEMTEKELESIQNQQKTYNSLNFNFQQPKRDMFNNSYISNNILKQGIEDAFSLGQNYEGFDQSVFKELITNIINSNKILGIKIGNIDNFEKFKENKDNQSELKNKIIELYENNESDEYFKSSGNNFPSKYNIQTKKDNKYKDLMNILESKDKNVENIQMSKESKQSVNTDYEINPKETNHFEKINNQFYWLDGSQKRPQSTIQIDQMMTKNFNSHNGLNDLISGMANDKIVENYQELIKFGQKSSINFSPSYLKLYLDGFDQHLDKLLIYQFESISKFDNSDDNIFDRNKLQILNEQKNFQLNPPQTKLRYYNSMIISTSSQSIENKIAQLEETDMTKLNNQKDEYLSNLSNSSLQVHGNLSKEDQSKVNSIFDSMNNNQNVKNENNQPQYILPLNGSQSFNYSSNNDNEVQNCVQVINQILNEKENDYCKNKVISELISKIGNNSIFRNLRTEKMMGQVTAMQSGNIYKNIFLTSIVQGNKQNTLEMETILREWQLQFGKELEDLPSEDFDIIKNEIQNSYKSKFPYLNSKSSQYFDMMRSYGDIDINFRDNCANEVYNLKKDDIIKFWMKHFNEGSEHQSSQLVYRIVGNEDNQFDDTFDNRGEIVKMKENSLIIDSI